MKKRLKLPVGIDGFEKIRRNDRKNIRLYGITFCKKRCCAISEKL